jgi:hypothetical protein
VGLVLELIQVGAGADLQGAPAPADASMENGEGEGEEVVEEKKKNGEKERKKKKSAPLSLMKVLPFELRKKTLDIRQRLKMKVESAIKFSPPRILSWIRHWVGGSLLRFASLFVFIFAMMMEHAWMYIQCSFC